LIEPGDGNVYFTRADRWQGGIEPGYDALHHIDLIAALEEEVSLILGSS
jgi:hypothetical protein